MTKIIYFNFFLIECNILFYNSGFSPEKALLNTVN